MKLLAGLLALFAVACGGNATSEKADAATLTDAASPTTECTVRDGGAHPHGCDIECSGVFARCYFANSSPFICQCFDAGPDFRVGACPPTRDVLLAACR